MRSSTRSSNFISAWAYPDWGGRSGLMWRDICAKGAISKDFRKAMVFGGASAGGRFDTKNVLGHTLHNVSDVLQTSMTYQYTLSVVQG